MTNPGQPVSGWKSLDGEGEQPGQVPAGATGPQPRSQGNGRPVLQRAPREQAALSQIKVKIENPPAKPMQTATSLLPFVLPLIGTFIMVAVMLLAFRGGSVLYILAYLPMMIMSYVAGFVGYFRGRKKYREEVEKRDSGYRHYLAEFRRYLHGLCEEQRRVLSIPHPAPAACLAWVERHDRRLWERSPDDDDFLDLRLGTGRVPASFSIDTPSQQQILESDPLVVEAQALANEYVQVADVPISLPLAQAGVVGLAGPRHLVQETARALLTQLATHHAPDEVKIILIFPEGEMDQWSWARWLPHCWNSERSQRFVAAGPDAAQRMLAEPSEILRQRQLEGGDREKVPGPAYVFVLADPSLASGSGPGSLGPLLRLLLSQGPQLGAYTLLLADQSRQISRQANAVVDLSSGAGRLSLMGPPSQIFDFAADLCPVSQAESLARQLAPYHAGEGDQSTDLPDVVPLLDLLEVSYVEQLPLAERWRESQPFGCLAAPIGIQSGGKILALDLHERGHGPHGLMAGATGAGKSELLQSFIASLAVHYHPHEMAVVLIDYKGGGMANIFRDLPHQIGIITNLEGSLAVRALAALRSEYQRRQRLFDQVGVNHIDAYQRLYRRGEAPVPLPHLAIIADEFAELVQNQPDFMAELVSGVRVGRSLGVHLILATQKPAGVVNDQIWGNARFRLCLRVEQPEDSSEVLRRPDAASIRRPGRAYFQVGMNEIFEMFQAAYGGAPYEPTANRSTVGRDVVAEVELDGQRRQIWPRIEPRTGSQEDGQSQLHALVRHIQHTAQKEGIERLQGPWLPPLPEMVGLDALRDEGGWNGREWQPVDHWMEPVVGLVDDPAGQDQRPLRLSLGKEGHLAIHGAPGSGKTTVLQTLITSLANEHSPAEVQFYLLDFGGRLLTHFEALPHVGGVLLPDQAERLHRLVHMLLDELERRKELLAQAGVGTLFAYREQHADAPPAVVVIIDNYAEFRDSYDTLDESLTQIAREGGSLGLHLVLTTSSTTLSYRVGSNVALTLALEMNDAYDYPTLVGRTGGLVPAAGVRGRGLVRAEPPLEFQTALPVSGETEAARTRSLREMMDAMADAWQGPTPTPVRVLPDVVALDQLLPPAENWSGPEEGGLRVPLGLDGSTLAPFGLDLAEGPHFLITGPPGGGKTTLLQSWLLALAERFPPERVKLYPVDMGDQRLMPFKSLPHTGAYAQDDDSLLQAVKEISDLLKARNEALKEARQAAEGMLDEAEFVARYPALVLATDDFDRFVSISSDKSQEALARLMDRGRRLGFHVLAAGPLKVFGSSYAPVTNALKEAETGFLLGSSSTDDFTVFNLYGPPKSPGSAANTRLPGRAYFIRRGQARLFQAASCHAGPPGLLAWIKQIGQRQVSELDADI